MAKEGVNINEFDNVVDELTTLEVYSDKKMVKDVVTNEIIFNNKAINPHYRYAKIFKNYVDDKGELLKSIKLKRKLLIIPCLLG